MNPPLHRSELRILLLMIVASIAALVLAAAAQANTVTFEWSASPSPDVSGYRVYQIIKADTAPDEPEIITYQQANTSRIEPDKRTFTTEKAVPGTTWTVRAYNIGGESRDGPTYTIPAAPEPPAEFKPLILLVQSSPDLLKWATEHMIAVAAIPPHKFYRLNW